MLIVYNLIIQENKDYYYYKIYFINLNNFKNGLKLGRIF